MHRISTYSLLKKITIIFSILRSLFIDALVASGTNPSFLFSKYLIEEKKVTDFSARSLLTRLSLNIKESSETLFNEFYVSPIIAIIFK
jgi:hypothetical protein